MQSSFQNRFLVVFAAWIFLPSLTQCKITFCLQRLIIIYKTAIIGIPQATLTSNLTDFDGSCRPVSFTCTVTDLESLRWFINGNFIAAYLFSSSTTSYPHPIYHSDEIDIQILSAESHSNQSDEFNATSILTTTNLALSEMNAEHIQCGTNAIKSSFNLTSLNVEGEYSSINYFC